MAETDPKTQGEARPAPVAPWWHTLIVVAIMTGIVYLGAAGGDKKDATDALLKSMSPDMLSLMRFLTYGLTIAMQLAVVFVIWIGLRLRKNRMSALSGADAPDLPSIGRDLVIAVGFVLVANVVLYLMADMLQLKQDENAVSLMMPHGTPEVVAFLLLSATVGVCEEIIFRGYLQKQVAGWTGSTAIGVVIQAVLFGLGHLWEGRDMIPLLGVYGLMFGLLAWWRRSLRPGIFAHVLHDGVVGVMYALSFNGH